MKKKFVLITTGQPSVNPRIVKEADALIKAGYDVFVLYCFWIDWACTTDEKLLSEVKWKYQLVGGSPRKNKFTYYYTRVRHKLLKVLSRYLGNNFAIAEGAGVRAFYELLKVAKAIKADWYIGHNIGAMPVVAEAAKANRAKSGFDFEDYHRQENENIHPDELKRIVYLEEKYCKHLDYISTSSPAITKKVMADLQGLHKRVITLLNCFPLTQQPLFRKKLPEDNLLQLFWFSQTIGKNRGLEEVIEALKILNDSTIHLTLAGNCNTEFKQFIEKEAAVLQSKITFAGVIQPEELPEFAAQFDVGLAVERSVPPNRDICLTNKIFTYLLAGNALILSKTAMQEAFNQLYQVGESFSFSDPKALADIINLFRNKELLQLQRMRNYNLAKKRFNWDIESDKFLKVFA